MKLARLIMALSLAATATAFAADKHDHAHDHAHDHDHTPKHGGVVVEVKDMDYELVARADLLQLYLRDHDKPVDVSKASARITLLSGAEKLDVEAKPAGDRLEAKGSFKVGAGSKAVAQVTLNGKTTTARFVLK